MVENDENKDISTKYMQMKKLEVFELLLKGNTFREAVKLFVF